MLMTDAAEQLAAAIRQVVNEAVEAALQGQVAVEPPPPEPPKAVDQWPPERMLFSLKEVQHRLSVSRTTIYELIGGGQLPSVTIGRRRFVTAAALGAYVEGLV
jgi:excisionase family DNA binding protein